MRKLGRRFRREIKRRREKGDTRIFGEKKKTMHQERKIERQKYKETERETDRDRTNLFSSHSEKV